MSEFNNDSITLLGKEIPVQIGYLQVRDLNFYPENPRIYSLIYDDGSEPSQEEIFDKLKNMEHVNELLQSIKTNGGLREPLIVRNNMVLEGNSRLAAYKILEQKDIKWAKVKCKILSNDVGDDVAFAILADHIKGKKDWAPYEQAGYLYRRHKQHNVTVQQIANDMGLTVKHVNFYINVYSLMLSKNEKRTDRWSYYFEYLRNNSVKKARDKFPDLDKVVVKKIKTKEIPTAADLRDKLPVILTAKPAIVNKFLSGECRFEESYEKADKQGHNNTIYKKLHHFRKWIVEGSLMENICELDETVIDKCKFELTKIEANTHRVLKEINKL
ncbi:MAG: hypothetical protein EPN93_03925 [Spirochaetes bacterium]|nr:MAG: hypothetical protein EPN93_03925 [Spirochaetota bacterium]